MKESTMKQIEAMKQQTIGVEIEMANITRQRTAQIIAEYFGTSETVKYEGGGYKVWSCKDNQGRTWKAVYDSSIFANSSDEKSELTTPILTYDDIEALQEIVRRLRKAGAVSNPNHGCGVHIHIGAQGHTPATLRNLANIMAGHETMLVSSLKLDNGRMNSYCKPVDRKFLDTLNEKKPETMSDLADVWYNSQNCDYGRDRHYNSSRYHMLNLHATFTKGTVEFRLFQFDNPTADRKGGLHAGQLKTYIQLCLAMSQRAKSVKTSSPKERQQENQKYAMNQWMMRLCLEGEEFKTARETLLKNLNGNAHKRNVAA